jgi:hypothetical protein
MSMMSEAINEISAALAKAQGQIEGASKGKVNPAFKSKYADLASIWDACREPLSANGLAVLQIPNETADGMMLVTMITHSSGQWFRSSYPVRPVQATPQGLGSALTYSRRYSLMAMVGIAPEDDDGEAAMGRGNQEQRPQVSYQRKDADTIVATIQRPAQPALDADKQNKELRGSQERTAAEIKRAIAETTNQEELKANYIASSKLIAALPEDLKAEVIAAKDAQKALLMDEAA